MSRTLTCGFAAFVGLAALLLLTAPASAQDAAKAEPAYLNVRIPVDAKLEIQGQLTKQTGELRRFVSPPLPVQDSKKYKYTLKVSYKQNDKEISYEKVVEVFPGKTADVDLRIDLRSSPAETAPPKDTPPKNTEKPKETKKEEKPGGSTKDEKPERNPDVIFVPSPPEVVDAMLELAGVTKNDLVYDLGCGDGIIVVTAAKKYGCKAIGFDIDPQRVRESLENVKKNKVEGLVTIEKKDIFTLDLSPATVVTLYLLEELNARLVPQLEKLKPGARIVSHDFDIPGLKADKVVTVKTKSGTEHTVYLFKVPLKKK